MIAIKQVVARVEAVSDVPAWIAEPYRHWNRSAQAFADSEMPYERALALAQGNPVARRLAEEELTKLGATGAPESRVRPVPEFQIQPDRIGFF